MHFEKKAISNIIAVAIVVVILLSAAGAGAYYFFVIVPNNANEASSSGHSALILYSADAYSEEASALESAFTANTGILMAPPKTGGSLLLAQQIAQGNPVSVFLSVSKNAVAASILGSTASGWAISFASDEMSVAYSNTTLQNSAARTIINSYQTASNTNNTQAWYNLFSNLTSGAVKVGISDPNSDPAGYRAWIVLEAAGYTYANGNAAYFVDRLLRNQGNITSSSAADLIAPLESGNIQFLFIYKSAAIAQKLNLIQLGNSINLGDPAHSTYYSQFTYSITSGVQKGSLIGLFLTVPSTSTAPLDSISFVVFVTRNSSSLLGQYGLRSLTPAVLYNDTSVPQPIQQLVAQGYLSLGGSL